MIILTNAKTGESKSVSPYGLDSYIESPSLKLCKIDNCEIFSIVIPSIRMAFKVKDKIWYAFTKHQILDQIKTGIFISNPSSYIEIEVYDHIPEKASRIWINNKLITPDWGLSTLDNDWDEILPFDTKLYESINHFNEKYDQELFFHLLEKIKHSYEEIPWGKPNKKNDSNFFYCTKIKWPRLWGINNATKRPSK